MRTSTASSTEATRPVKRSLTVAVGKSTVYHYLEQANELRAFDLRGQPRFRMLLPRMPAPPPFTPGRRADVQVLDMIADDDGSLWLETVREQVGGMRQWLVISESGEARAEAHTPSGGDPIFLEPGNVLLRFRDPDGVETIRSCPV
jgi:hypothetical protein